MSKLAEFRNSVMGNRQVDPMFAKNMSGPKASVKAKMKKPKGKPPKAPKPAKMADSDMDMM